MSDLQRFTPESRRKFAEHLHSVTRADNTQTSYKYDWIHFQRWCEGRGLQSLPATEETIIAYLLYWGDPEQIRDGDDVALRASTLQRRVFGIRARHKTADADWPGSADGDDLISDTVTYLYIKQEVPKSANKKKALSRKKLNQIIDLMDDSPIGIRNSAILLLTFYSAQRRSSVMDFDLESVTFDDDRENMRMYISRSKTDQRGKGRYVYVSSQDSHCPVDHTYRWIKMRGDHPGPLFTNLHHNGDSVRLNPVIVSRLVKWGVSQLGDDPNLYGAHSLRSGFVTQAAKDGVDPRLIKEQTGHASYEMLDHYIQEGALWQNNATRRNP